VQNGGAERPDAQAPAVVERRFARPAARAVHPGVAGAAECLRVAKEPQRSRGEAIQRRVGAGFPNGDDERPRDVVGAIADVL